MGRALGVNDIFGTYTTLTPNVGFLMSSDQAYGCVTGCSLTSTTNFSWIVAYIVTYNYITSVTI